MRALALVLLLATTARGDCPELVKTAVGPRSIQAACSYRSADIAAAGELVFGTWMTSNTSSVFGHVVTLGSHWGGPLDARGHLLPAEQHQLTDQPGSPSVATNGQLVLLAWARAGAGTLARFLDPTGAPTGSVIRVGDQGAEERPPRAIWNGRDFVVVYEERPNVQSVVVAPEGTLRDRTLVRENASLADADGELVVVESGGAFELVTPTGRHPLPIPSGAAVALGDGFVAWHAGTVAMLRLDSAGAPLGAPVVLGAASPSVKRIAAAGDVVLWNDENVVRGARTGGSVRPIAPREGSVHAAAVTSEGVVALVGSNCASVMSYLVPPGGTELQAGEVVSRATVGQWSEELVRTSRGHDVYWLEPRPFERVERLFVTHVEGTAAREPVALSAPGLGVNMVEAAPAGSGSTVVWFEYRHGQPGGDVRLARLDAEGRVSEPLTLTRAAFLRDAGIVEEGDVLTIFTVEHAEGPANGDLWRTDVRPDGSFTRELLRTGVRAASLEATAGPDGAVIAWTDHDVTARLSTLYVRDARGTRAYPIEFGANLHALVAGRTLMVLSTETGSAHAFFPDANADVLLPMHPPVRLNGAARADGSFDVAAAGWNLVLFRVTPSGVVAQREELCPGTVALALTLRGGTVDAFLTADRGAVYLASRYPARRRAVR